MKTALALLLAASACLALADLDRFVRSTTNGVSYIAATRAHYELVPELVPLPLGATQRVVTMRRMLVSGTAFTNRTFNLTLRGTPPFQIDISTNLLTWEPFMESTNSVAIIEICAEQQKEIPNAFFRAAPLSRLLRIMRGY